jgi:ribosomal protein S18 acetylase RimI-like enzyme
MEERRTSEHARHTLPKPAKSDPFSRTVEPTSWQTAQPTERPRDRHRPSAVVGFSVVVPGDDGAVEIDGLLVEPEFGKRGIGRRLVAHAVTIARAAGARALRVVVNPRAAGFYAACGFEIIGAAEVRFGSALSAVLKIDGKAGRPVSP